MVTTMQKGQSLRARVEKRIVEKGLQGKGEYLAQHMCMKMAVSLSKSVLY